MFANNGFESHVFFLDGDFLVHRLENRDILRFLVYFDSCYEWVGDGWILWYQQIELIALLMTFLSERSESEHLLKSVEILQL